MNKFISSTIFSAVVASLLLLAGSGDLFAQSAGQRAHGPGDRMHRPPSVDQVFAKDDKDGDGLISKDEFGGPVEHFPHLDADGDGYLTREEVAGGTGGQGRNQGSPPPPGKTLEEHFAQSDTDGDGVLSAEEFTGPPDHFSLIDVNEDGVLTKEELAGARDRIPPPRRAHTPRRTNGTANQ